MKRTNHWACAIALVFLAGLIWSAQAQNRFTTVKGIEVSPGIEDPGRRVVNGMAVLGKTTGLFSGSLFMSMNYNMSSFASFPPVPTVNTIKNGTWSLPVYRSNQYLGAIYGRVVDGTIEWNEDETIAKVNLLLSIDGGTQTFAKANGKGTFTGTLDRTTRGKPTMNGGLDLQF